MDGRFVCKTHAQSRAKVRSDRMMAERTAKAEAAAAKLMPPEPEDVYERVGSWAATIVRRGAEITIRDGRANPALRSRFSRFDGELDALDDDRLVASCMVALYDIEVGPQKFKTSGLGGAKGWQLGPTVVITTRGRFLKPKRWEQDLDYGGTGQNRPATWQASGWTVAEALREVARSMR